MNADLVPALDPTPIPGPPWLFHVLLVFTFIVHVVFMNLALGGTILAALSAWRASDASDPRARIADRLVGINTYAISMAITTGVAPLLFVQVLYPQFFYTATILVGEAWISMLVLLMVGYYAFQRFFWEFLKPYGEVLGPLNIFHVLCIILMAYALVMVGKARHV